MHPAVLTASAVIVTERKQPCCSGRLDRREVGLTPAVCRGLFWVLQLCFSA